MIHPRQNEDIRCILAAMKKPRRLAFENDADHGIIHAKTTLEFGEKLIRDERYKEVNPRAAAIALFFHDFGNTLNRFFGASRARRQTARVMHEPWGAKMVTDAMRKLKYDEKLIADVENGIQAHDSKLHETPIAQLVSDADKLALYPDGVERILNFAKTKGGGRSLFNPANWDTDRLKPINRLPEDTFHVFFVIAKLSKKNVYSRTAKVELGKLRKSFVAKVEEHISGHEHEQVMRRLLAESKVQTGPKFDYTY